MVAAITTTAGTSTNALQQGDAISAAATAGLNATDPDSVIAFFQVQMSTAQGQLNSLMEDQQQRSKDQTTLQNLSAQLTQFEESGVKPGDANWDTFTQVAAQLKPMLTDGSDASNAINKILDAATTATGGMTPSFVTDGAQAEKDKQTPGVQVTETAPGMWMVLTPTGAPGISSTDMKSLDAQLKSITDGMTSDTSMQMVRVQQGVEQCSEILNLCTDVMKKTSDAADNAISNIR